MRLLLREVSFALLAIVGAVLLALTSTMTSIVALAASQIFAMGGTGHPLSSPPDSVTFVQQYLAQAANDYVAPAAAATPSTGIPTGGSAGYTKIAIITPEQFPFLTGEINTTFDQSVAQGRQNLDSCIKGTGCSYNPPPASDAAPSAASNANPVVVFGYSQSATIVTLEKTDLAGDTSAPGPGALSFVVIGNPNRPNGGFLARGPQGFTIPILGATFSGPTPTNTPYSTVDIARQYDGWADGPENPLDLLADANAIAGIIELHGNYGNVSLGPGDINQGQFGDTTYYLIPTQILPLLMPLEQLPLIGTPLADTLDPTLRVLVEAGYNRTISPGQPTPWNLLYSPDPLSLVENLLVAIPTGLDNGIQDLFGVRPLGTQRPGPYGVGGPTPTYFTPTSSPAVSTAQPTTLTPSTTPAQSATTTAADTNSAEPTASTNSAATIASPRLSLGQPLSDSPPGTRGSTTSPAASVPAATKPPQPLIRLPIGASHSDPNKTTATTGSFGSLPVSTVPGGPRGALKPATGPNANSKTPAGKAGKS